MYSRFIKRAVAIFDPQKGEKILDLCYGAGRAASWIACTVGKDGEVVGIDAAERMVEVARDRYGRTANVIFLKKDVTQPWGYQYCFDGVFISFALHEFSDAERRRVIEQSYLALKEKGRMVIADFNPQISGRGKTILRTFCKFFERENLNFLLFEQRKVLERVGFEKIRSFPS